MITEQGSYKPRITFETPKRLEEAAGSDGFWQPVLKDADEGNTSGRQSQQDQNQGENVVNEELSNVVTTSPQAPALAAESSATENVISRMPLLSLLE